VLRIEPLTPTDESATRAFVLGIQNGEFHLGLTEAEQPDLQHPIDYFATGGFWTAKADGQLVGTIGLKRLDATNGVLKKMFVAQVFRGREVGLAQQLYDVLLAAATRLHLTTLWLDTPSAAAAAHKFYERNGFVLSDKASLPLGYSFPHEDSKIYRLQLA
jgi:N-acetylglutamate synthase-like GNAT family acetyltransferase